MTAVADCTPSTDAPETALPSRRGDAPVKIERLSRGRRLMLDVLRLAARQPTIHRRIKVDVPGSLAQMRSSPARPTMTAYVVAALGQALHDCPEVNVRRAGRHVIKFAAIDIAVTIGITRPPMFLSCGRTRSGARSS